MQYLKIENPGVCPKEGFTLLGASTKRSSSNDGTVGRFGSGNKHGVNVCLRYDLYPVVFCNFLKLEFGIRPQKMSGQTFNRVFVKYGGKDDLGTNRSSSEDLGYVVEYGATDWLGIDLALREFVSNALDSAMDHGEAEAIRTFITENNLMDGEDPEAPSRALQTKIREFLVEFRKTHRYWEEVKIEIVEENQVRAKAGTTRVFIPLNDEVLEFHRNLGKWFLHFSEPESLKQTILPKRYRNLEGRQAAVIYRRGVRVREFESSDTPSLFDYNLNDLQLDESRRVDDWHVQHFAAQALIKADENQIARVIESFVNLENYWEHDFQSWAMNQAADNEDVAQRWMKAWTKVAGSKAVVAHSTFNNGQIARKGYKKVSVADGFLDTFRKMGMLTTDQILTEDDLAGRDIVPATLAARTAVDFVWNILEKNNLTNGKVKPPVFGFTYLMDCGGVTKGFYRDEKVYLNVSLGGETTDLSIDILKVALEELGHYLTQATDESRDFQDFAFMVAACLMQK